MYILSKIYIDYNKINKKSYSWIRPEYRFTNPEYNGNVYDMKLVLEYKVVNYDAYMLKNNRCIK